MEERYSRNIPALSEADMARIRSAHVLVLGCGGLGGFILEYLLRAGVGAITAVDGDVFSPSNLNRQLLCTEAELGLPKAEAAKRRAAAINPEAAFTAVNEYFTEANADRLMEGIDLVLDGLDNVASRFVMEDAAARHGLTVIHGAIEGWNLQVMTIPPGSGLLHRLYVSPEAEFSKTALSVTPACCAAYQVSAALQYLSRGSTPFDGQLAVGSLRSPFLDLVPLL